MKENMIKKVLNDILCEEHKRERRHNIWRLGPQINTEIVAKLT